MGVLQHYCFSVEGSVRNWEQRTFRAAERPCNGQTLVRLPVTLKLTQIRSFYDLSAFLFIVFTNCYPYGLNPLLKCPLCPEQHIGHRRPMSATMPYREYARVRTAWRPPHPGPAGRGESGHAEHESPPGSDQTVSGYVTTPRKSR